MKHAILPVIAIALLAAVLSAAADTRDEAVTPADRDLYSRIDRAVARGARYLLSIQEQDGSFSEGGGPGGGFRRFNHDPNANAMTSLSIMALAAIGNQPSDKTPEGIAMASALRFMLRDDRVDQDGYYGSLDGSRMYGHGITTLMFAEMLGMGVDDAMDTAIRARLQKAVDLILRAQRIRKRDPRYQGGWRYLPGADDSDLSITVWQVMALRAARNAGIDVPKDAIDKAIWYIKGSYISPRDINGNPINPRSAFSYQPDRPPVYSTAAEGLLALQVCGEYDAPEVKGAADWLRENGASGSQWLYYGTYYYAQGMYQRGGIYAEEAKRTVAIIMLPRQDAQTGAWLDSERNTGPIYATTLAMLSLSVKHHFLPIYQR